MPLPAAVTAFELINVIGAGASISSLAMDALDESAKTTNKLLVIINQTLKDGFNGLDPQSEAFRRYIGERLGKIESWGDNLEKARTSDKEAQGKNRWGINHKGNEKRLNKDIANAQGELLEAIRGVLEHNGIGWELPFDMGNQDLVSDLREMFQGYNEKGGANVEDSAFLARKVKEKLEEVGLSNKPSLSKYAAGKGNENSCIYDLSALKTSITEALNPLKGAIEKIDLCCCEDYVDKPIGTSKTSSTPAGSQDAGFFVSEEQVHEAYGGWQKNGLQNASLSLTEGGEGDGPTGSVKEIGLAFEDLGNNAQAVFGRMVQSGDMSVKSLLKSFKQLAISSAFNKILPALLGGGDFGGIVSGGLKKVLGFASGGKPPVGVPSIVGERGPELFIPDISGRIANTHNTRSMMGGAPVVVNQSNSFTSDVQNSVRAEILNAAPMVARQAASSVMAQMNGVRR